MKIEKILSINGNIADELDEDTLVEIGHKVVNGFDSDKESRSQWEERNADALRLALQVRKEKSFPWPGAANVKYPLVTIACMQFSSRAYPALIPNTKIVKHRVVGNDATGEKQKRALRVSEYMNYQLTVEDESWEDDMDRLIMSESLLGTAFKKTYFDDTKQQSISEMVTADNLVLDYFARSVEEARRKTHVLYYHKNTMIEKMRLGSFSECKLEADEYETTPIQDAADEAQGKTPPLETGDDPFTLLEQHCWLDLDEDGYEEPYVVTVLASNAKVLRIRPRFFDENITYGRGGKIAKIEAVEMFTKFGFIPSPDGSIYDVGLGVLLGPINESVNTIINQLIDAGTLSNLQSGFLAKGIRVKNGRMSFVPGEWKSVNSTGDDLRKGIVPLPVRDPSQVLFQLLGMLIDGGQKIGAASDMMTGESPGQNQPATTTMAVLEQGLKVYSTIIKRNHRALTSEFRKLYKLNGLYLNPEQYYEVIDPEPVAPQIPPEIQQQLQQMPPEQQQQALQQIQQQMPKQEDRGVAYRVDFQGDPKDIAPASDPNIVSDAQRLAKAEAQMQIASQAPYMYNMYEVNRRYLEALQVEGISTIMLPEEQIQPPQDPKAVLEREKFEHQKEMDQFNLELSAQETVVNMKKKIVDTQRSQANAENVGEKMQLETAKYIVDTELRRAELIAKTLTERNKIESEEGRTK